MKPLPYCTAQMLRLMRNVTDDKAPQEGIQSKHVADAISATVSRGWVRIGRTGKLHLTDAGATYLKSKEKK